MSNTSNNTNTDTSSKASASHCRALAPVDPLTNKHIVDQLIEERAQKLRRRPRLWNLLRPILYPLFAYERALRMVETLYPLKGKAIFQWLSEQLQMRVTVSGLEHLPAQGTIVIVANHPAGIADGIATWDALKSRRQDLTFFANRDAIRAAPGLADSIIPVEWIETKRTHERSREMVRQTLRAFRGQRVVVIFPSGRLARPTIRGLVEREWLPTAVSIAQKYQSPILPMYIEGRNSWLYYLLCLVNDELRDMTLFRELFNKRFQTYRVRLGEPFYADGDTKLITPALRAFVADDMANGATRFELPGQTRPVVDESAETQFDRAANGE